jgi:hypothetical protein
MQKKNTTSPRKTTTSPSRAQLRAKLARDLAAVISNPETPVLLYNEIADVLCDMSSDINYHTPEMIERTIAAHVEREAKRAGGAS